MSDIVVLDGSCRLESRIDGSCGLLNCLDGLADKVVFVSSDEYYTGDYTVTPGDEAQVLETEQLKMNANVIIEAIPSDYGKITWNGSVLVVS